MEKINTNMFDVKVKLIRTGDAEVFESMVNETLEELGKDNVIIHDIQYGSVVEFFSAMIIYSTSHSLM